MDAPTIASVLLVLGIAQGLFLAALLLARRENAGANRILAGAMVAFSLFLLEAVIYVREGYRQYPHLIGISQPVIYVFGPAVYLYTRSLCGGARPLGRRAWLHLLPALVVTLYMVPFFLKPGADKIAFVDALARDGAPLDLSIIEWLKLPHGALYTYAAFRLLGGYRTRLEEHFSTLDRINLIWLRNLLIATLAVWLVAILESVLGALGASLRAGGLGPVPLALALMLYAIGYLGLRQPEVFWPPAPPMTPEPGPAEAPTPAAAEPPVVEAPEVPGVPTAEPAPASGPDKYRKSGLDPATAEAQLAALLELMETQKPYTDPELTLPELAGRLDVSPHNLSEVINTRLGKSFHDFVNGYRVEDAKRRLLKDTRALQTILAIAYDSGFRSKSTFNKIFKKFTGLTPSAYRAEHQT